MPAQKKAAAAIAKQEPVVLAPRQKQVRTIWKGSLQIGLITLPLQLYTGARAERQSFRQLHSKCLGKVKQQPYFCDACDEVLKPDATGKPPIVKGFEYAKDQYVVLTEEEIEAQKPESARFAEITNFVDASEVDPVFFEGSFYMLPGEGGLKAYNLIRRSMIETKKYAIGKMTMYSAEHVIIVRPYREGLVLHTMFYLEEMNAIQFPSDNSSVSSQEIKLASQLIQSMSEPFDPTLYSDNYASNIRALAAAKLNSTPISQVQTKTREKAPLDLLGALQASIDAAAAQQKKKKRA